MTAGETTDKMVIAMLSFLQTRYLSIRYYKVHPAYTEVIIRHPLKPVILVVKLVGLQSSVQTFFFFAISLFSWFKDKMNISGIDMNISCFELNISLRYNFVAYART